jgi:hypothetical protein
MLLAVGVERLFQLALPDEAPGSNHVRDDVYLQFLFAHSALRESRHLKPRSTQRDKKELNREDAGKPGNHNPSPRKVL